MKNLRKWLNSDQLQIVAFIFALFFSFMAPSRVSAEIGDVFSPGNQSFRIDANNDIILTAPLRKTPDTSFSGVLVGTTIVVSSAYHVITADSGSTTLTTTPSVSTTTTAGLALPSGFEVTFRGTSDTDFVVFTDDDTLAGSQLELGANTRDLGEDDILVLIWDATAGTTGRWLEKSYSAL